MKQNNILVILLIVALLIIGGYAFSRGFFGKKPAPSPQMLSYGEAPGLTKEVNEILDRKIDIVKALLADPVVVREVKASNAKHAGITQAEIDRLDKEWRADKEGQLDWVNALWKNTLAQKLLDFQKAHPEFPEVFIADAKGLNAGQTNRTSDYYQADEDWWIRGYANGQGEIYKGEVEYDESAQAEVIGVFLPVIDPATNQAIGVVKALVDITAIKLGR